MNGLEVPHPFAGARLKGDQGIGEQIIADTVAAIKVKGRRTGGQKHQTTVGVEAQAAPDVGSTCTLVSVGRPCLVPEFAGMWDGMKNPNLLAREHVKRADMTGHSRTRALPGR